MTIKDAVLVELEKKGLSYKEAEGKLYLYMRENKLHPASGNWEDTVKNYSEEFVTTCVKEALVDLVN